MASSESASDNDNSLFGMIVNEVLFNPLNFVLLIAIATIIYKMFSRNECSSAKPREEPSLPPMKKKDFTLEEMRQYDGKGTDGRILVAVNGKVFDVTKGKRFYGPDGPYSVCAGRDASVGLATFSLDNISDAPVDLSNLSPSELDQVREWEAQFTERYTFVGKLLKPGEQPTEYSDVSDHE